MTDAVMPVAGPDPLVAELARIWPDGGRAAPARVTVLALLAGAVAAVLVVDSAPGLGLLLTGVAVGAASLPTLRHRLGAHELAFGALGVLLLSVVVVRDAPWLVALSLLAAFGLASYALVPTRGLLAGLLTGISIPLAGLRCLPWLRRGLQRHGRARSWLRIARVGALTGVLLLVFGALFASADAAFAALIPSIDLGLMPVRLITVAVVAAVALSAAFLGAAPPRWDALAPPPARPVRTAEWLVPIAMLDTLFAGFVAVQLTVLFGGHRHVLETAGLTYAEYARAGFGQLVVVTLLTLSVVAATVRWAPRETRVQRAALRALLGALCVLALVIVGSALYRLHLYEEAFGFTRLRLFMNAFETWLGVLVGLVLLAGVRLRAAWLARAVVATAAVTLLTLAAINPDAFVAQRNVDRYQATGKIDLDYLQGLSADAVPVLDTLPEPQRSCVLSGPPDWVGRGLGGWNLSRSRAADLLDRSPVTAAVTCADVPG
jgi:hypothetical protein